MKIRHSIKTIFLLQFAFVLLAIFALSGNVYGQETVPVRGTVIDQNQQPIIGATIQIEGTTTGTVTDANGAFSIKTQTGKSLIVSYVGYKTQKVAVTTADAINVQLEEDMVAIDEAIVVAVGYGKMRKSDLTGAIASVSAENMKQGVVTSSEQLLQGKVAGLTIVQGSGDPASGASMRLRGGTSLSASNGPLVVVDGIAGVDINSIQPSEITSMDVLKDASATAIYGSRGANGVIIVSTNRAKKGQTAEYSGYVAIGQVAKHMDLLSANQWRQYVRDNNVASAVDYGGDTDWQKELEQTSISHSHNLSFNNSGEDGGYRASVSYLQNEGVVKRTGLERLGASVSAHHYALNKKLKLEAGVHTNFDKWNTLDNRIFLRSYNLNPTIPVKDANGEYTLIAGTNYENPVEIMNDRNADNKRHRLLGYGNAELEITKELKGVVNVSYEYNSAQAGLYKPTYAVLEGLTEKGYAQKTLGDYVNKQIEIYLSYNKEFEGEHKLGLMAGYSYLDNTYDGFGAERRGFNSNLFTYNNLGAGMDFRTGDVYSYKGNAKLISFFGRLNYSLLSRYMLTATLRRDGSSRFGDNNKWGLFPSASAAWRISDEAFMESTSTWLNNLKLRVGYGVTGNQDGIGEYKSLYIFSAGSDPYIDPTTGTFKQSYGPSQNANPDLKWESTAQTNIGLDFSLFNRINGTIELYNKKTSDLLYTYEVPQPPYIVGTMLANVGDLTNKGIELSLNAGIIKNKDFSWDVNFNISHNQQKIDKLSNQTYKTDAIKTGSLHGLSGMSNQYAQIIKEGYPVGTFWGPKCHGLDDKGKFVVDTFSQDLGNVQPKLSLGFGMNFTYKNLDLSFSTYGMFGQKVLNASAMMMNDATRLPAYNVTDDFLTSGIKDKAVFSDYWIEDASFLRIQSVTLGYTLKVKNFGFEKIRFYATGENLFVFTKYKGVDPEISIDGLASPGMDVFNYYPKPRTVLFGVNLSF
jgi:iron complex outermembrane receptor protein